MADEFTLPPPAPPTPPLEGAGSQSPPLPPGEGAGERGESGITATIMLVFEHSLHPAQRLVIERARSLMLTHEFELHNFEPTGENIQHIRVPEHIRKIELGYDESRPEMLAVRFTVNSKQDRDALVWTSSLFFQYLHYHVARIATVNDAPHHMDWEAQQDPQAPARIKGWVEQGQSLIERLHKTRNEPPFS